VPLTTLNGRGRHRKTQQGQKPQANTDLRAADEHRKTRKGHRRTLKNTEVSVGNSDARFFRRILAALISENLAVLS
jgi:hypothetical protein